MSAFQERIGGAAGLEILRRAAASSTIKQSIAPII
jgi:hypothetical protein